MQKRRPESTPVSQSQKKQTHVESLSSLDVKEFFSRGCFGFIPLKRTWSFSDTFPQTGARLSGREYSCLATCHLPSTCLVLGECIEHGLGAKLSAGTRNNKREVTTWSSGSSGLVTDMQRTVYNVTTATIADTCQCVLPARHLLRAVCVITDFRRRRVTVAIQWPLTQL